MSSNPAVRIQRLTLILIVFGVQVACALSGVGEGDATVQALSAWLAPTASALANTDPETGEALATAGAQATKRGMDIHATQTALALQQAGRAATATAFAPILDELPLYGLDPNDGEPGWIHPAITLELDGYQQNDSTNHYIFTVAEDFALSADITWNTQYGTSGCGFVLRSDGDEETPNQYMVLATRASLGHVVFMILSEGEIAGTRDIYARGLDPAFDFHNDATNRLTVVGEGTLFRIYTNTVFIGEIDVASPPGMTLPSMPPMPTGTVDAQALDEYADQLQEYQEEVEDLQEQFQAQIGASGDKETIFERGFVAMIAMSESGRTVCRFDRGWLWLIDTDS